MKLLAWLGTMVCLLSTHTVSADAHMCRAQAHGVWSLEHGLMMGATTKSMVGAVAHDWVGVAATSTALSTSTSGSHATHAVGLDVMVDAGEWVEVESDAFARGDARPGVVAGVGVRAAAEHFLGPQATETGSVLGELRGAPSPSADWLWCISADDPRCFPVDDGADTPVSRLHCDRLSSVMVPVAFSGWRQRLPAYPHPSRGYARPGFYALILRPPGA